MRTSLATLRRIHRINAWAPIASLAALAVSGYLLSRQEGTDLAQAAARAQAVRSSLAAVPFVADDWVGADCPLPAGAAEILMPTAVLSRRFAELGTGRRATLGIIHCGDVRDMHGHHPPSCYPASGWQPRPEGHDRVRLSFGEARFDASLYRFSSTDATGARREVSVVGFFVLPDADGGDSLTSDMSALRSRAALLDISRLGVGQIQIVIDGWPPVAEVEGIADELLAIVPADCLRALQGRPVAAGAGVAGADEAGRGATGTIPSSTGVRLYGLTGTERIDRTDGVAP
jgi:hypothetical protein